MRRIFFYALIIAAFTSCSRKDETSLDIKIDTVSTSANDTTSQSIDTTASLSYEELFKLKNYLVHESIDLSDLDSVANDCAILIYPTSAQVQQMIAEEGEDAFYIGADDSNWYQGLAIEMIDSMKVTTFTATKRFLILKGNENTWTLDIRKKELPAWNLIFFKRDREPKVIPTIDLTLEKVKEYFESDQQTSQAPTSTAKQ